MEPCSILFPSVMSAVIADNNQIQRLGFADVALATSLLGIFSPLPIYQIPHYTKLLSLIRLFHYITIYRVPRHNIQ